MLLKKNRNVNLYTIKRRYVSHENTISVFLLKNVMFISKLFADSLFICEF